MLLKKKIKNNKGKQQGIPIKRPQQHASMSADAGACLETPSGFIIQIPDPKAGINQSAIHGSDRTRRTR